MRLEDWRDWLSTAPLPDKLAFLAAGRPPDIRLTPEQQHGRYTEQRAAYERGECEWADVEAWLTPPVLGIISKLEDEQRAAERRKQVLAEAAADARKWLRRDARRHPLRTLRRFRERHGWHISPDGTGVIIFVAAFLYFIFWVIVSMGMGGSVWPGAHHATHACSTVTCLNNWQQPPLRTEYTGPGTLVTEDYAGHQHRIAVSTVIEKTNGFETRLPIFYVDQDGKPGVWHGVFWFVPDHAGARSGM